MLSRETVNNSQIHARYSGQVGSVVHGVEVEVWGKAVVVVVDVTDVLQSDLIRRGRKATEKR